MPKRLSFGPTMAEITIVYDNEGVASSPQDCTQQRNCSQNEEYEDSVGGSAMKTRRVISYVVCLATAGCASSPGSIEARYVSPSIYQNFTCAQLFEEKQQLFSEVERVSGLQRENANADTAMMTVGLIILWPVLFGLAATKDREEELGRLKGEYEAVNQQIKMKQCALPAPTTPASTQEAAAPAATESEQTEEQPSVRWSGTGSKDGCDKPYTIDVLVQDKSVKGQLDRDGIVYSINGRLNSSGDLAGC